MGGSSILWVYFKLLFDINTPKIVNLSTVETHIKNFSF